MINEIEEDVLGNLLLKPELMKQIVISEDYFLDITNKFIFKILKKQYQDSNTINILGISQNYKHLFNDKFNLNDIIMRLSKYMSECLPIENLNYYQQLMLSRYTEYKIMESIKNFQNQKISKDELINDIHKYESLSIKSDDERLNDNEIFKLINSKNKNINIRFKTLSNIANIQEHDLVIIAARTGIGKSGFCLNLMEDLSEKYNCIYFNMEMSEKQVYQRLVAINTGIPMIYHDNPATNYQLECIKKGCLNISNKKIKVFNQVPTVANIRQKIMAESKLEHTIVFVDHVGLIKSLEKGTTYEKVTSIVKELRQISLDYDCTIFLISQLSRNQDEKKRPTISELRDSGELEQSATTVMLLHDENHDNNRSKKEIDMEIIIGKNRNGQLGINKLKYNKENQRYDELDKKINDPNAWRKG